MGTGIVLAGGGTKGAFEAGALRWLVEEHGVIPDVVTATSVGALLAAVLAQGRTNEELAERCRELRDALLAMTQDELVFGRQPWLERLAGTLIGRAVDDAVMVGARPPVPGQLSEPGSSSQMIDRGKARDRSHRFGAILRMLPSLLGARRLFQGHLSSVMTLDPLAQALRHGSPHGIPRIDPALVARPGLQLRIAVTALGTGVLRYVCEDGRIVERDGHTTVPDDGPHDLVEGVLASASVPMVFPPRRMGSDVYMDGGVLENIPVRPAALLGATRIFALLAVPLANPVDSRDFMRANAFDLLVRATGEISFSERQHADLATPLPPGTVLSVIDPLIDIVSPFEVVPGLMRIDMDYGWMRAADLISPGVADANRALAHEATNAAIVARVQAWHMEESVWSEGRLGSGRLRDIRAAKATVRDALAAREEIGFPSPPAAETWWSAPEYHSGPPPASLTTSLLGAVDADVLTRPPAAHLCT